MAVKKTVSVKKKIVSAASASFKKIKMIKTGNIILSLLVILIVSSVSLTGLNIATANAYNSLMPDVSVSDLSNYNANKDANVNLADINEAIAASTSSQISFVSDSSNQCYNGVYDEFNQATTDSKGVNYNSYDTTKWVVGATAGSSATTQTGKALYFATGDTNKSLFGSVFTTKKPVNGDFTVSIKVGYLSPNVAINNGSLSVFRLGTWQAGSAQVQIMVYKNNKNQTFVGLYKYNPVNGELTVYDTNANAVNNFGKEIGSNAAVTLKLERAGDVIKAYYSSGSVSDELVGEIKSVSTDNVFLVHGYGVLGQDRTLTATADDFTLKGCFAQ